MSPEANRPFNSFVPAIARFKDVTEDCARYIPHDLSHRCQTGRLKSAKHTQYVRNRHGGNAKRNFSFEFGQAASQNAE
jgi:hypothetical protein